MKNMLYGVIIMCIVAGCASQSSPADEQAGTKTIAITFDDGPSAQTGKLLAVLGENNITATFFLIGQNIRARPEQARQIFAAGHEIGNHSDGYSALGVTGTASENDIRQSLAAASAAIQETTGGSPSFFRAPNLDYGDTLIAIVREMGMALIGTDVIGRDWEENITTERIINNVLTSAKDGGVILLHELYGGDTERTLRAVPVIARELRLRKFEIVTVGELARRKGVSFEAGKRYDTIN
jgi:peptidoglycan/xylan/chitin deacetylase (PgdA/CDA1 family)